MSGVGRGCARTLESMSERKDRPHIERARIDARHLGTSAPRQWFEYPPNLDVSSVFAQPRPTGDRRRESSHSTREEDAMARAPMKLHVKKNQLHKDVGKAPGDKITEADIAKEKSKGGVYAKRAQFAENAKKWNHPGKGKR